MYFIQFSEGTLSIFKQKFCLIEISQTSNIKNILPELAHHFLNFPVELRDHIHYCLFIFARADADKFNELFLPKILPAVSAESSLPDISTVLNLTYRWIKTRENSESPSFLTSYTFLK